ncbi:MAG: FkbM family methyltransferase [Terriglobales bacterium]
MSTASLKDMSTASPIKRLQQTLVDFLRAQLEGFALAAQSEEQRLQSVRHLCAIISSTEFDSAAKSYLLSQLHENPAILPIPGGCAEFSFNFWRDLRTIATMSWEPHNMRLLRRVLREGSHVVDIGAHVGHFTIYMAHLVGPTGRVLAVEPAPDNFSALQANLERNGIQAFAKAIQVALCDMEGTAALFHDGDTGGTEYSLFSERHGNRGVTCQTNLLTLDALVKKEKLGHVDFVKIDTEGAELAVLRGSEEMLGNNEVSLLVELHPWIVPPEQVCKFLQDKGFQLYLVSDQITSISCSEELKEYSTGSGDIFAAKGHALDDFRLSLAEQQTG